MNVTGATQATAEFDVTCAALGEWQLSIRNPGSAAVLSSETVEITECTAPLGPAGATDEGEGCGGGFGDTVNGGCFFDPPLFSPISCGEDMCGIAWANSSQRDTDWYELVLTETTAVQWSVAAEFPLMTGLMATDPPGSGSCDDWLGILDPVGFGGDCAPARLPLTLEAGTYWFYVAVANFDNAYSCNNEQGPVHYTASLTCGDAPSCPADFDGNGEVGPFDLALLLGFWEPCEGDCPWDLDGNGEVGPFDLAILLGSWGPCP